MAEAPLAHVFPVLFEVDVFLSLREGGSLIVATEPGQLERVRSALAAAGYPAESAEVSMEPTTWVEIADEKIARQVLTFVERLEDLDDVQNVYANFDIPTQLMEQLEASVV